MKRQPISVTNMPPKGEKGFLVYIPSTRVWWPGYRSTDKLYSRSHGVLNEKNPLDGRILKATYWLPMPFCPAD